VPPHFKTQHAFPPISPALFPDSPIKIARPGKRLHFWFHLFTRHKTCASKNSTIMKLKMIVLALLGGIFILQSCIPSIHPIYTEDTLVEVNEIPGVWLNINTDDDGGRIINGDDEKIIFQSGSSQAETWTFSKRNDKSYLLIHVDEKGRPAAFDVHIIKLDENYFMDFYPTDMPNGNVFYSGLRLNEFNSFQAIHLIAVHTFAKMELKDGLLTIRMFDPDFLQKLLERKQIRIKHEETEDGYILTASPEELQKFASKYAHVKEAFLEDPIELKNKP
jgi:hypothetical protein